MEEENLPEESFGQVKGRVGNQETMWKSGCKHLHPDHRDWVRLLVDPSMWPKQQGGVGQSSGAPPALICPGTSRSRKTSGQQGRNYLQLLYLLEGG